MFTHKWYNSLLSNLKGQRGGRGGGTDGSDVGHWLRS